jgi:bacteriorhodopsin
MHVLLRLLINAAALWVATRLVSGISYTGDGVSLFGVALVFGVLNVLIKPILFLLSLPVRHLHARALHARRQRRDAAHHGGGVGRVGPRVLRERLRTRRSWARSS